MLSSTINHSQDPADPLHQCLSNSMQLTMETKTKKFRRYDHIQILPDSDPQIQILRPVQILFNNPEAMKNCNQSAAMVMCDV